MQEDTNIELNTIATLNITSTPEGAKVYVDSNLIGMTPLRGYQIDTSVRLEKQVNVGLELSGYKSRVKKITLKGGQHIPWNVHLEKIEREPIQPKPSVIETPPEKDPGISEEKLLISRNTLQTIVGNDGTEMVLIPAGEFEMGRDNNATTEPVHTVYVHEDNTRCVYVDSNLIGMTPLRGYQIDTSVRLEKQVNVGLELSGYKSRVKKITLKGGQHIPWNVHLEKIEREPIQPKPSVIETPPEKDFTLINTR